jgi:hypothetical protein
MNVGGGGGGNEMMFGVTNVEDTTAVDVQLSKNRA